jgi:hypothetical protein
MSLQSHAGNGLVEATLAVGQCCYRVMLEMALPSFAGDGTTEATLAVALCRC